MKKSNLVTLLSFCFFIVVVILFMSFWKNPSASAGVENNSASMQNNMPSVPSDSCDVNTPEKESPKTNTPVPETTPSNNQMDPPNPMAVSMEDALFIGDSRTVGLMEYAGIEGADFFCSVGMSVYNIHKKPVSVPKVGKVTLTELLNNKKYGKIYIMLGINEVGYKFDNTVSKYSELINFINEKQPDTVIFIQANLHVSKKRSDSDKVINNTAINRLNAELSQLADGKSKFYLDANPLFDDTNGSLACEKTGDSTHLYANYYPEWGKWIIRQTASLIREG